MSTPGSYEEYLGKVNAPDFPPDMDWINVESPVMHQRSGGENRDPGLLDILLN